MTHAPHLGLMLAIAFGGCHKAAPPDADKSAAAAVIGDAIKDQAFKDLQNDIGLLKMQLGAVTAMAVAASAAPAAPGAPAPAATPPPSPAQLKDLQVRATRVGAALYTCDRLAIAGKELADDVRAQALLGEADSLCAYQAPLAAGELKLAVLAGTEPPKIAPADCGPIREALNRVGAKYKNDPRLAELVRQFKTQCPRMRLGTARPERSYASGGGSSSGAVDRSAERYACKKRCDDASFDCRSRCMYCGSCTSDKTWEWCNATCNNCKQGCEQNERFCQSSCGS